MSVSLAPLPHTTARPVDPNFDFGQTVLITDHGFVPKQLIAAANFPVTWKNTTERVQGIHFDNDAGIDSGPIPPGGSWSYTTPTTISIVYHSTIDPAQRGAVQMQPLTEP